MTKLSEYDELLKKLLEEKPDLTKERIDELIRQKKEKVGAGYLTDNGALFLIASDLGVNISEPLKVEMELKDIYSGAKEVTIEARILNISKLKELTRKDDGTIFFLRTMTIYDSNNVSDVKLWEEGAKLPNLDDLKPGDLIKIIKAYTRPEQDGTTSINIGSSGNVERSDRESNIPSIDAITKDVGEIKEGDKNLAISGLIDGEVNCIRFTNSRGQPGTALNTRIKGKDETSIKVIVWGKDETDIPDIISQDAKIRLLGVDVKPGNQGIEIQGDDATVIEIEGSKEASPIISRIISIVTNEEGKRYVQSIDKNKNIFRITDLNPTSSYNDGDVIECIPTKAHGQTLVLDERSFVRKLEDDNTLPKLQDVRTKINDVKGGGTYCIEAIILKTPERKDIITKNGESIVLSEMFVEDDTGQIWVKGWRNLAGLIDKNEPGEVVSITGLNAKPGLDDRIELFLSPYSNIKKI